VLAAVVAIEPTLGAHMADIADELGDRCIGESAARWLDAWRGDGVCVSGPRTD